MISITTSFDKSQEKKKRKKERRVWPTVKRKISTHVFDGSVAGDLLKLAADQLRPRFRRLLALVPYTDHARDYQRH